MNNNRAAITLARNLKKLRQEAGYSNKRLSEKLKEEYEVEISEDALMLYEIDNEYHSKAKNGLPSVKMRVDTLYRLADFYGVSMDYLLGKDPISSGDPEQRATCHCTGLSPEAVASLSKIKSVADSKAEFPNTKELLKQMNEETEAMWKFQKDRLLSDIETAESDFLDLVASEIYSHANLDDYKATLLSNLDYYSDLSLLENEYSGNEAYLRKQNSAIAKMSIDGLDAILKCGNPETFFSLLAKYLLAFTPQISEEDIFIDIGGVIFESNSAAGSTILDSVLIEIERYLKELRGKTQKRYKITRGFPLQE